MGSVSTADDCVCIAVYIFPSFTAACRLRFRRVLPRTLLLEATTGPGELGMLATIHDALLLGNCSGGCNAIKGYHQNFLNSSAAAELAGWLGTGAL